MPQAAEDAGAVTKSHVCPVCWECILESTDLCPHCGSLRALSDAPCPFCGKPFPEGWSLTIHVDRQHPLTDAETSS
jgi:predicted amidophosphoribosyltransferase